MKKTLISIFVLFISLNCLADVTLSFRHFFEQSELKIEASTYKLNGGQEVKVSRLKYYIGNIVCEYASGYTYTDSVSYHLIDLDDSSSLSLNLENIPEGKIININFGIGVDSSSNAKGLMDGDLDPLKGMYWAWSSGFINFKLEGVINGESSKEFKYHIGGFLPPHQSYQSVSLALNKNVVKSDDALIILAVDISTFLNGIDVEANSQVLSPSIKSKEFSTHIPNIFKVIE